MWRLGKAQVRRRRPIGGAMNAANNNAYPVPPAGWVPRQPHEAPAPNGPWPNAPAPNTPTPLPQMQPTESASAENDGLEFWLGRKALGVVAAFLVLLGIVLFGVTVIPYLTDEVKVGLMFALSAGLMGAGGTLSIVRGGNLGSAVMGCGAASLLATILIAHARYAFIGEVLTFGLMIAWMVACLALMRSTRSLMLAIVLQLGLATSVYIGYVEDFAPDMLGVLLAYQVVASAVVVAGNKLFFQRAYRSSLVLALAMNLVASLFVFAYCGAHAPLAVSGEFVIPAAWLAGACAVQLTCAAVLSALLVKSCIDATADSPEEGHGHETALLVVAALAWCVAARLNVLGAFDYCAQAAPGWLGGIESAQGAHVVYAAIAAVLQVAFAAGLAWYARKRSVNVANAPAIAAVVIALTAGMMTMLGVAVEGGAIWSVCLMACALACVAAGFRFRVGGLRAYGLVMALVCVAKLVMFDIELADPANRAVALVIGGLICFAISALYNRACRYLAGE